MIYLRVSGTLRLAQRFGSAMIYVAKITIFLSCYLFDLFSVVADGLPWYVLGTVYGAVAPASAMLCTNQSLDLFK